MATLTSGIGEIKPIPSGVDRDVVNLRYSVEGLGSIEKDTGIFQADPDLESFANDIDTDLRLDNPQTQELHYRLGCWNFLHTHLIPIVVHYRDNDAYVFAMARLATRLTMPLDPKVANYIERQRHLQAFKSAFADPDVMKSLMTQVGTKLDAWLTRGPDNAKEANTALELYLILIKNLLQIENATDATDDRERFAHDRLLLALYNASFFDVVRILCLHVVLYKNEMLSLVLLEILYNIFKLEIPSDLTLATTSTQIQGAAVVSPTSASQGPLPTTHLLKGHKPVDASSQVPAMKTEAVIPKASGSLQALKNAVATRAKLATSTTTSMTTTNANASSNRSSPLSTSSQLPSTIDITSHNRPHKYVIGNLPVAKELASKLSVLASGNGRGLSRSGSLSTMSSSDVKRHSRFGTLIAVENVLPGEMTRFTRNVGGDIYQTAGMKDREAKLVETTGHIEDKPRRSTRLYYREEVRQVLFTFAADLLAPVDDDGEREMQMRRQEERDRYRAERRKQWAAALKPLPSEPVKDVVPLVSEVMASDNCTEQEAEEKVRLMSEERENIYNKALEEFREAISQREKAEKEYDAYEAGEVAREKERDAQEELRREVTKTQRNCFNPFMYKCYLKILDAKADLITNPSESQVKPQDPVNWMRVSSFIVGFHRRKYEKERMTALKHIEYMEKLCQECARVSTNDEHGMSLKERNELKVKREWLEKKEKAERKAKVEGDDDATVKRLYERAMGVPEFVVGPVIRVVDVDVVTNIMLMVSRAMSQKPVDWLVIECGMSLYSEVVRAVYEGDIHGDDETRAMMLVMKQNMFYSKEGMDMVLIGIKHFDSHKTSLDHLANMVLCVDYSMRILEKLTLGSVHYVLNKERTYIKKTKKPKPTKKPAEEGEVKGESDKSQNLRDDGAMKDDIMDTAEKSNPTDLLDMLNGRDDDEDKETIKDANHRSKQRRKITDEYDEEEQQDNLEPKELVEQKVGDSGKDVNHDMKDADEAQADVGATGYSADGNETENDEEELKGLEGIELEVAIEAIRQRRERRAYERELQQKEKIANEGKRNQQQEGKSKNATFLGETDKGEKSRGKDESDEEQEVEEEEVEIEKVRERREAEFNFGKYVMDHAHPAVIKNYMALLRDYRANEPSINESILSLFEQFLAKGLAAMFFHLSILVFADEVLQDESIRIASKDRSSQYGVRLHRLRNFFKRVAKAYFEAAEHNPLVFVETLFWTSQANAEYILNPRKYVENHRNQVDTFGDGGGADEPFNLESAMKRMSGRGRRGKNTGPSPAEEEAIRRAKLRQFEYSEDDDDTGWDFNQAREQFKLMQDKRKEEDAENKALVATFAAQLEVSKKQLASEGIVIKDKKRGRRGKKIGEGEDEQNQNQVETEEEPDEENKTSPTKPLPKRRQTKTSRRRQETTSEEEEEEAEIESTSAETSEGEADDIRVDDMNNGIDAKSTSTSNIDDDLNLILGSADQNNVNDTNTAAASRTVNHKMEDADYGSGLENDKDEIVHKPSKESKKLKKDKKDKTDKSKERREKKSKYSGQRGGFSMPPGNRARQLSRRFAAISSDDEDEVSEKVASLLGRKRKAILDAGDDGTDQDVPNDMATPAALTASAKKRRIIYSDDEEAEIGGEEYHITNSPPSPVRDKSQDE